MRWRFILMVSLGLNVVLGATFYCWFWAPRQTPKRVLRTELTAVPSTNAVRTNVIVRRLHFSWEDVESDDYAKYIDNLREIGCPEPTIRDIIVADVNQLYAKRQAAEIVSPDQQWWRSDPDPSVERAANDALEALDKERRELLARLLGTGWNASQEQNLGKIPLTGAVLGSLPKETKRTVQDLGARANKRLRALLESGGEDGKPVDPAALARLRKETREELARILTPEQLEEYLLRYSQNAVQLRNELRGQNLTPDEFRRIFRARDPLDQQLQLSEADDTATLQQRRQLEQQREKILQTELGPERYQAYMLNKDPLYVDAKNTAERLGVSPSVVMPIYQVNQLTELERQRIRNDNELSTEEKIEAIKSVLEEQQKTLLKLLGEDAYERFEQGLSK
ncbi:MAG: hypothetical protein ABI651_12390 [Verrucomicrobiota bacterium]